MRSRTHRWRQAPAIIPQRGVKGLAKMSFQMAGKAGGRCQQFSIHRAALARKRQSFGTVVGAGLPGEAGELRSTTLAPPLQRCNAALLLSTATLETSRSSPCSRVLTVRPVLPLAPSQLSHHSPSHADLHFSAAHSDSLAAGFVLFFFLSISLPTILPPPRLATGTPPTLLPPPSCASHSVPSFLCVSHISIAGLRFMFEHGAIGKFDFAGREQTVLHRRTE